MEHGVSVILPVAFSSDYLEASVYSILRQTYRNLELVVVVDGTDTQIENVLDAIKDNRLVYYVLPENLGISGALNFGLSKAKFDFIARMDSDDIADPRRLEEQMAVFAKNDRINIVSSQVIYIDSEDQFLGYSLVPNNSPLIIRNIQRKNINSIFHPTVMFKKSILDATEGYENIKMEDLNLWRLLIAKDKFNYFLINRYLLKYRIHDASLMSGIGRKYPYMVKFKILAKILVFIRRFMG